MMSEIEQALRDCVAALEEQRDDPDHFSMSADDAIIRGRRALALAEQPAQPSKPWVGLTDVEWMNIVNKDHAWFGQRPEDVAHEVAKLVEAKLKDKNGS